MNPIEAKKFLKYKVLNFMKENNLKYDTKFELNTFDETMTRLVEDITGDGNDINKFCKHLELNLHYKGPDFINFVKVQSTLKHRIYIFNIAVVLGIRED